MLAAEFYFERLKYHMRNAPPVLGSSRLTRCLSSAVLLGAVGALFGACSGSPPSPPPTDLGGVDLALDQGRDLGGDGGEDQGPSDLGTGDAGMTDCTVESPSQLGSQAGSIVQRIAITHRGNDFALVFRERRTAVDDLWVRVYRDAGQGPVQGLDYAVTTDAAGMSVSSISRDPAVVATASSYIAGWIDNRDVGFEMWTRVLDADGVPAAALERITTTSGRATSPALTRASDGTLLAGYVLDDLVDGTTSEFFVGTLATGGALSGSWTRASSMGEVAGRAQLAPGQTTGFVGAWIDATNTARVRPVTTAGAPTGTIASHGSVTALALDPTVLVLGRNTGFDSVWAQPLASSGAAMGLLRNAVPSDATGREPGVAPLFGGVVVAYRHTSTDGVAIALALLNSRGERVHTEVLGATTDQGGPISVDVNNEGRIRLAWAEVDGGTTTLWTQAVQCTEPL